MLNGCNSEQTRRAYAHALEGFFRLHAQGGLPPLSPSLVVEYRRSLLDAGKSASTINVHLAAIKALVRCGFEQGLVSPAQLAGFEQVRSGPVRGRRMDSWLTREQARELLRLPDRDSLKGKRDAALQAVLLGCALRRAELVVEVRVDSLEQPLSRCTQIPDSDYTCPFPALKSWTAMGSLYINPGRKVRP